MREGTEVSCPQLGEGAILEVDPSALAKPSGSAAPADSRTVTS